MTTKKTTKTTTTTSDTPTAGIFVSRHAGAFEVRYQARGHNFTSIRSGRNGSDGVIQVRGRNVRLTGQELYTLFATLVTYYQLRSETHAGVFGVASKVLDERTFTTEPSEEFRRWAFGQTSRHSLPTPAATYADALRKAVSTKTEKKAPAKKSPAKRKAA